MSIKIGFCSDLHITNSNPKYDLDDNGVSELIKRQIKFSKHFVDKCEEEGVDTIVFAGDLTDSEHLNPVEQSAVSEFCKAFESFSGRGFILSGNHTVFDKVNNQYSVVGAISNYVQNTKCITLPNNFTVGSVRFHFYPYTEQLETIKTDIKCESFGGFENSGYFEVCVFHFPIRGAKLDNGYPSESGLDLSEYPMNEVFDLCVGGDFHRPQFVEDNLFYVGAPFDLKFGDYTDWRGFRIVEVSESGDDWSVENFENPYNVSFWSGDYEEFQEEKFGQKEVYANVKGDVSEDERKELEKMEDSFYNLSKPVIGKTTNEEKEQNVETLSEEDYDEEDLIRKKLKQELSEEEVERGIEIFKEVTTHE